MKGTSLVSAPHVLRDDASRVASQASKALAGIAALTPEAALEQMQSSCAGLSNGEAKLRHAKFGMNAVEHEARRGTVRHFLTLLASPLSLLLLALATWL